MEQISSALYLDSKAPSGTRIRVSVGHDILAEYPALTNRYCGLFFVLLSFRRFFILGSLLSVRQDGVSSDLTNLVYETSPCGVQVPGHHKAVACQGRGFWLAIAWGCGCRPSRTWSWRRRWRHCGLHLRSPQLFRKIMTRVSRSFSGGRMPDDASSREMYFFRTFIEFP